MIAPTDPHAGYEQFKDEIDAAIRTTLDSGWYILGQQVKSFEAEFAAYVGVKHCVGVASGTDAIELGLRACGVGPAHVVLTVSHTAVATVSAIDRAGAVAALVDIDEATFNMDPNLLERAIAKGGEAIKAIVPVHMYGHPADMSAIREIARRHGVAIVEDCAQAHGAAIEGTKVGTWGDLAAFSFYPTKNLGALGDGGCVLTDDDALSEKLRALREYGWEQRYVSAVPGINSRLDELQAAILRVKLAHLDADNVRRQEIAQKYDDQLREASEIRTIDLVLPTTSEGHTHVYHQYVVRASHRDALRQQLRQRDVGTLIHYPVPVHQQPAYVHRAKRMDDLAHTEQVAGQIVSLPMYPQLTDEQVDKVSRHLIACLRDTE